MEQFRFVLLHDWSSLTAWRPGFRCARRTSTSILADSPPRSLHPVVIADCLICTGFDPAQSLPPEEAHGYALRLADLLAEAANREPQFVVMVDRSPAVQAVFVYWGSPDEGWSLVGASPASTGLPGAFEQSVDTLFDLYQLHRARGA